MRSADSATQVVDCLIRQPISEDQPVSEDVSPVALRAAETIVSQYRLWHEDAQHIAAIIDAAFKQP